MILTQIKKSLIDVILSGLIISSCGVSRDNQQKSETVDYSGTPTLIYKTKKDYYNNVPVILSADKSKIVNYPAISDVYFKGVLAYPFQLADGYLLDNRGINENTAFLKYTYEEYSKLKELPKLTDLYSFIIDKEPFVELYNCGNRYRFKDEIAELNEIIKSNKLKDYKRLR
ncbi:MAG: hypothetical protein NT175_00315 [Bacteroidetes bacterium]|nr:hypothetical protein [Bacteroidota bacterium]